jgi:hypothetical protein
MLHSLEPPTTETRQHQRDRQELTFKERVARLQNRNTARPGHIESPECAISISHSTDPKTQSAKSAQSLSVSGQDSEHGLIQSQHGQPQPQPDVVMSSPPHPALPLPPSAPRSSHAHAALIETRLARLERFKQRVLPKRPEQVANPGRPSSTHAESSSNILPRLTSAAVMPDPSLPLPTPAELKPHSSLPASTPASLEPVSSPLHQQTQSSSSAPPTQLSGEILELSDDSDDDHDPQPLPAELLAWYANEEKRSILATETELLSRQLHTPWAGSNSAANWICRPEQRNISQAAQDRDISHDILPRYVSCLSDSNFLCLM